MWFVDNWALRGKVKYIQKHIWTFSEALKNSMYKTNSVLESWRNSPSIICCALAVKRKSKSAYGRVSTVISAIFAQNQSAFLVREIGVRTAFTRITFRAFQPLSALRTVFISKANVIISTMSRKSMRMRFRPAMRRMRTWWQFWTKTQTISSPKHSFLFTMAVNIVYFSFFVKYAFRNTLLVHGRQANQLRMDVGYSRSCKWHGIHAMETW